MKFDDNSAPKSIVIILIEFSRGVKKKICEITVSCVRFLYILTFCFWQREILITACSQWQFRDWIWHFILNLNKPQFESAKLLDFFSLNLWNVSGKNSDIGKSWYRYAACLCTHLEATIFFSDDGIEYFGKPNVIKNSFEKSCQVGWCWSINGLTLTTMVYERFGHRRK